MSVIVDPETCTHEKHMPAFDLDAAREMTPGAIRKAYPRFFGKCKDCEQSVIIYASFEHYQYGDW